MRRRNRQSETGETLGKTDPLLDFHFPDRSGSDLDLKRRKRVTFAGVDNRSPSNDPPEARAGRSVDAKTSEYAFFKKLKSDSNHRLGSKMSNNVEQSSKMLESSAETRGTKDQVKDEQKSFSFSTPVETARREKNLKQCSPAFRPMCSGDNNTRTRGITNQTGDVFSMKRKKLHQWVRDIWFPDITELSSSGYDLVPGLLTRLFPEKDKQVSEIPKERVDRVKKLKFLDSPGSEFLNRLCENYTEVQQRLHMETGGSIFWLGWPEESIAPSLQFPTAHVHRSFTLRDPEEIRSAISYPKGDSVYRPSFSKQKALAPFCVEETLSCPISSPWFRSYKPLSPIYHREKERYRAENLLHEQEEPTLLLEWDTVSMRNTDDLPLGYQTNLITYPNVSSSSGIDNPWNYDEASHDLDTKELYSLPLLSYKSPDSFSFPITNPTNHSEHKPEWHNFEDNALHTFHHMNSSDGLTRNPGYYHQLSYSPVKHYSFAYQTIEAPGYNIISSPFSSPSYANLLEAPSPRGTNGFKSRDRSQAWIDS